MTIPQSNPYYSMNSNRLWGKGDVRQIWEIIGGKGFCSFKKIENNLKYCFNPLNITSICSRQYCPLSSEKYATIVSSEGNFFLYLKIGDHMRYPSNTWKKIRLSRNYIKAIQQIDKGLVNYPKLFVYRAKQKLTKLHQINLRRKCHLVSINASKINRNEKLFSSKNEESKVMKNFPILRLIEHELLSRLHIGVYGHIYKSLPISKISSRPVKINFDEKIVSKNIRPITINTSD
mmetsp:Transcript_30308/g.47459  ORF Transcript_30308/g.47459 Transcript_30308/m.47459 type:complete len:233 (+) Transcript_30308:4836-5534(+)